MPMERGKREKEEGVEDPAWIAAMELATMCVVPMVLRAALNIGVFQVLAKAGAEGKALNGQEILEQLPVRPTNPDALPSLERLLRFLATRSILSCTPHSSAPRQYSLTPMCKYLVNDTSGLSLASHVLMNQDHVLMATWNHLDEAILHGGVPFVHAHGTDAFTYGQRDNRFDKLFNWAMSNHTGLFMKFLLDSYHGFDNVSSLVDVGGGTGYCINLIVSKYPHIRGINFDQPHVVASAPSYSGVEHVGGDMFVRIPSVDAIFMKWILHDWSDDHCVSILKNCYKALPKNGKVIVADIVLPEEIDISTTSKVRYNLDMLMFAYNMGGKERTKEEFHNLAMKAGFVGGINVCCSINEVHVIEFYKSSS